MRCRDTFHFSGSHESFHVLAVSCLILSDRAVAPHWLCSRGWAPIHESNFCVHFINCDVGLVYSWLDWSTLLYQSRCRVTFSLSMLRLCYFSSKERLGTILAPTLFNVLSHKGLLWMIVGLPSDYLRMECAIAPAIIWSGVDVHLHDLLAQSFSKLRIVFVALQTVCNPVRLCPQNHLLDRNAAANRHLIDTFSFAGPNIYSGSES